MKAYIAVLLVLGSTQAYAWWPMKPQAQPTPMAAPAAPASSACVALDQPIYFTFENGSYTSSSILAGASLRGKSSGTVALSAAEKKLPASASTISASGKSFDGELQVQINPACPGYDVHGGYGGVPGYNRPACEQTSGAGTLMLSAKLIQDIQFQFSGNDIPANKVSAPCVSGLSLDLGIYQADANAASFYSGSVLLYLNGTAQSYVFYF